MDSQDGLSAGQHAEVYMGRHYTPQDADIPRDTSTAGYVSAPN